MDTDPSYENHSDASREESSRDNGQQAVTPHGPDKALRTNATSRYSDSRGAGRRRATETKEERWQRLRRDYNDQYLLLLNESASEAVSGARNDFDCTKIGLTSWSASEKEKFFCALSRKSKVDLRGIATSIQSKSELETYNYLLLLEEENRNTHLFAEEARNVSHAEIPAAAEVSIECEAKLEKTAYALNVYQDRFDQALGEQVHHDGWLIDRLQAEAHDQLVDDAEDDDSSADDVFHHGRTSAESLFRLSAWLSLSERIFMNSDPTRNDNNWSIHAAKDEVPAITKGAISDLYQLALYQTHKIMQTSIFCAESRIRGTSNHGYRAKAFVKEDDVKSAVSLLGLTEDRSQFWLSLARRNQLKVVSDDGKKGQSRKRRLGYDEVERMLSKSSRTRRGRRSVSSASELLSLSEDLDSGKEGSNSGETNDTDSGKKGGNSGEIIDTDSVTSEQAAGKESLRQSHQPHLPSISGGIRLSPQQKSQESDRTDPSFTRLEEDSSGDEGEQDRHLESLDQIESRRIELQLYHDLGWAIEGDIESRHQVELPVEKERVRVTGRKATPDLLDWRDSISGYAESWENHGEVVNEASFEENQTRTKQRRIDQDVEKH